MSKYIVTGGAGFIGSHLTDHLLDSGHDVIVIDDLSVGRYQNPKATTVQADIRNIEAIKPYFKGIDGCFHLAAIPSVVMTISDWLDLHAVNLQGSLNIFQLAISEGPIPVIYASSCAVYGETKDLPLTENQFIQPISSYGCDKLSMDFNANFLAKSYNLPIMGLRFFNVYGPRQNPDSPYSGVISRFINRLMKNESVIIYGDGNQTRDFIYVEDVVAALVKAMTIATKEGDVVNMCTGQQTNINQLAQLIAKLLQKPLTIDYQPKRIADVIHSVGSTEKMHAMGFNTKSDLTSGLEKTIEFIKENC